MVKGKIIGTGLKAGFSFFRFFKLIFILLFFAYLLISIVLTGIQERDFTIVVKELGEEFTNPLKSAQEFSIEMQQTEGGFLSSLWEYWGFYFELFKIYLWILLLKYIVDIFLKGTTAPIMRIGLALMIFLFIQTTYGVYFLDETPMFVFEAFKDILDGLMHIFTTIKFREGSESIITPTNNCSGDVCVI